MTRAFFEVRATPAGPAFVQDLGRPGYLSHAVPRGGALVPELLAAANRAVGNAPDAAALELFGGLDATIHSSFSTPARVSLDGATVALVAHEALEGSLAGFTAARFVVARPREHRVQYVAVSGGFDVPVVLGGRGTLALAAFGGSEGRALRPGDRVPLGAPHPSAPAPAPIEPVAPHPALVARVIRVLAGPDLRTHFAHGALDAFDALVRSAWSVDARSDRGGLRLAGPALARTDALESPQPMVPGAIEVARDGAPLVLGPDHPTTGGYPVLAVVVRADLGALFARRPGTLVRFERAVAARVARVSAFP